MKQTYYKQKIDEIYHQFNTTETGLTGSEAEARLTQNGPNAISVKGESLLKKLAEPFLSVFMLILGIAIVISLLTNEHIDAIIIGAIIFITAVIYYVQRFSADRVLRALERHDKQYIEVMRDGQIVPVESESLVIGDVLQLNEGQKIPADARVIHAHNVRVDEAMLTGESMPVQKHNHPLHDDKEVYEQSNMLFQGAYIVSGSTTAVVVATGNQTEFGQLAALSSRVGLSSPVKDKIDTLISQIVSVVAVLATLVFLLSMYRGIDAAESLRLVLTFSVSAIPEGLPVAISVVLVLGMRRMARHKALVRSMSAIENVGIVTTVATDKTGTLTRNNLTVQDVWSHDNNIDLQRIATVAYFAINQNNGTMHDPLDYAIADFVRRYHPAESNKSLVAMMPFDLSFAMSGNTWRAKDGFFTVIKGSPEKILANCKLSKKTQEEVHHKLHELTGSGYRVIGLATHTHRSISIVELGQIKPGSLQFIGLLAIADELREEAFNSVKEVQAAGVTVRMITGDHFETAYSIGKKLGLVEHRDQVFDSTKMSELSDDELREVVAKSRVFSRVLPENKYKILTILKEQDITAMTGDGVNDVPALSNAHIGFAMGSGSQIAKEAGDIILLDDNFASVSRAIKQGRIIFDNIRRMLFYLLSTNVGEVLTTVMALVMGLPLPLLPIQILWTNLGTDTAMVIPLGLEPAEREVMKRPPRKPRRPILGRLILKRLVIVGTTIATVALSVFWFYLSRGEEVIYARTMVFSALVAMQLTNAINARSEFQSIYHRIRSRNYSILAGLIAAIGLYVVAVFGPMQGPLSLTSVPLQELAVVWLLSIVAITFVNEVFKVYARKKQ